jgi:hypothetical protein
VLGTGRCGTNTFIAACGHMTSHTAGHETKISLIGEERLEYPTDHIEADNRLSWMLGRLGDRYGDDAFYVHLTRDEMATAQSFVARYGRGIMRAYRVGIVSRASRDIPRLEMALDYVRTVNSNIATFLRDRPNVMHVHLETAQDDFRAFWLWIGAEGDLDAALAEWDVRHSATEPVTAEEVQVADPIALRDAARRRERPRRRVRDLALPASPLSVRFTAKSLRVFRGLPRFLRDA